MARLTASLLLVWALFLGPALCAGGLLEHACDCSGGVEAECDHEEACADDPCATASRPDEREARFEPEPGETWVPATALWGTTARDSSRGSGSRRPPALPAPPARPRLPYAASDRPLRI